MLELNRIYEGDCLEVMKKIDDKTIDMILADLPYGITACKWDSIIPLEFLWKQYKRIIKDNGVIVLTASQPFTSKLVMSNLEMFKYEWIWDKVNMYTGAIQSRYRPLRRHESILIFYHNRGIYNKQYRNGQSYIRQRKKEKGFGESVNRTNQRIPTINNGKHNPCSILPIRARLPEEQGLHPTQKPVALFEYLIRTYTYRGNLILDNVAGSGTTAVACINTGRNYILIEKEKKYVELARQRIKNIQPILEGIK